MRVRFLSCLFFVTACGGGDDAPAADAPGAIDAAVLIDAAIPMGTATITGELAEETIDPTTAYYITHPAVNRKVLVMAEGGSVCRLDIPATGLYAVVWFPCEPATVATYPAYDPNTQCTPDPYVAILAKGFTGEFPEYVATAGSATFTAIGPTLHGTFVGEFGTAGMLTGTFDAVVCP